MFGFVVQRACSVIVILTRTPSMNPKTPINRIPIVAHIFVTRNEIRIRIGQYGSSWLESEKQAPRTKKRFAVSPDGEVLRDELNEARKQLSLAACPSQKGRYPFNEH